MKHRPDINRPKLTCGQGRTVQYAKDECDINLIMRDFHRTGLINFVNRTPPIFGDAPEMDYHQAMNMIVEAQRDFELLPAKIRERFQNDPGMFLDFMGNEENREEAQKLGLIATPPPKPPETTAPAEPSPTDQ